MLRSNELLSGRVSVRVHSPVAEPVGLGRGGIGLRSANVGRSREDELAHEVVVGSYARRGLRRVPRASRTCALEFELPGMCRNGRRIVKYRPEPAHAIGIAAAASSFRRWRRVRRRLFGGGDLAGWLQPERGLRFAGLYDSTWSVSTRSPDRYSGGASARPCFGASSGAAAGSLTIWSAGPGGGGAIPAAKGEAGRGDKR